jgi:hypothetical protein
MFRARQQKGIVVRTANKVGALAEFSKIVAETGVGVGILAMSAWVEDTESVIRLICEDTPHTMDVLQENGYDPQDRDVVLVDAVHQPGLLRQLTETLAGENIDIFHLFASAVDKNECLAVLNTSDNERAIDLLNG